MKINLVLRLPIGISALLLWVFYTGCISTKKSTDNTDTGKDRTVVEKAENAKEEGIKPVPIRPMPKANELPGSLEINGCYVVATLLSIDPSLDTLNPNSPCGQVPCGAKIKVNKIIKMGQQCAPYIVPGIELNVYFKITLSSTKKLFPDMKQHFPGLEKSDTFATRFVATKDLNEGAYQIAINGYTKVE